jgi:hypothetical protein
MPGPVRGSASSLKPLSLVLAACLGACVLDPQASRTGPASTEEDAPAVSLAVRTALPESACGQVDSAVLRLRHPGAPERSFALAIRDSALEARLSGLEPGPAEIEVFAYVRGELAWYGAASLDPEGMEGAQVMVNVGRVGTVRIEGSFGGAALD